MDPRWRWPLLVAERLRAGGAHVTAPMVVARTGWTTDELALGMEQAGVWPPSRHFDIVSLLIGVNDQYRGRGLAEFAAALEGLLGRAVELAGGTPARVLAVSIPDWGVTPFAEGRDRAAIAHELDDYNTHVRRRAAALGAQWGDVTTLSRSAHPLGAALAADSLHPAASAYEAWADVLAAPAARALRAEPPQD